MHKPKPESKETQADEDAESPAVQKKEQEEGTEMHTDGVVLPEQFQKDAHALVSKASTKHHTNHIRRLVDDKEEEHRKKEQKGKKEVPSDYSTADMPA